MCGICGIVSKKEKRINEEEIILMRDKMTHRGPDDFGLWVNQNKTVALGHRRLSIIDLSKAGHQPMTNEKENLWLTFNGEIYNYLELKEQLEKKGHRFISKNDSETVIHAYEEWGVDFVAHLDGMFAFGLYDINEKQLVFARDRIGKKPFYYYQDDEYFIFASEIKAILSLPFIRKELNSEGIYHYLTFMTIPAPHTIFKNISKAMPSHCYMLRSNAIHLNRYWDPLSGNGKKLDGMTEHEIVEQTESLLIDSIKKRTMSDVPIGAFLSGGIDSSYIVSQLATMSTTPLNTFSLGFTGEDVECWDESYYAKLVANRYNTRHSEIKIGKKEYFDSIEDLVYFQDEPIGDPACISNYYVANLAKESGVKVVYVGEGSDENFVGYDFWLKLHHLSEFVKKYGLKVILQNKYLFDFIKRIAPILGKERLCETLGCINRKEEIFWGGAMVFEENEKKNWLNEDVFKNFDSYSCIKPIYKHLDSMECRENLNRWCYLDLSIRLPELLLMRVDKFTMAGSIEARVPFLDYKLVEFALQIPASLKVKNNCLKYILKKIAGKSLPSEIINRKKIGFPAPVFDWIENGFDAIFKEAILGSKLLNTGYFNKNKIETELDTLKNGYHKKNLKLWMLTMFAKWADQWL